MTQQPTAAPRAARRPELWRIAVYAAIVLVLGITKFDLLRTAFTKNAYATDVVVLVVLAFSLVVDGLWRRYIATASRPWL